MEGQKDDRASCVTEAQTSDEISLMGNLRLSRVLQCRAIQRIMNSRLIPDSAKRVPLRTTMPLVSRKASSVVSCASWASASHQAAPRSARKDDHASCVTEGQPSDEMSWLGYLRLSRGLWREACCLPGHSEIDLD